MIVHSLVDSSLRTHFKNTEPAQPEVNLCFKEVPMADFSVNFRDAVWSSLQSPVTRQEYNQTRCIIAPYSDHLSPQLCLLGKSHSWFHRGNRWTHLHRTEIY